MDLGLAGRSFLVLASSRGLGRAIARELAEAGAKVMLSGRSEAALQKAADVVVFDHLTVGERAT